MGVAIKASFGKKTKIYNGLDSIAGEIMENPTQDHYVIAKVRTARKSTDYENGGEETPTVKFVHIEVMQSNKEIADAVKLFERAAKARLGEVPQATLFDDDKADGDSEPE